MSELPLLDLSTEADDDWLKKAYPGGIEKYRADEAALHELIQREHDAKVANKGTVQSR